MNDHVLLNISTVTGKWFRKFVFNFNLTGDYHSSHILYRRSQSKFIFNKSSAKNDSHYDKSTVVVVVFTVKLDAINSFPSNTAEVRPICLKMGHIMRKPVFGICKQQRRRSACASTQSDQRLCCSLPG